MSRLKLARMELNLNQVSAAVNVDNKECSIYNI